MTTTRSNLRPSDRWTTPLSCLAAFAAGSMLAAQAGFNARLGVLTHSTLLASVSATLTAFLCLGLLWLARPARASTRPRQVPPYLWGVGGALSALALTAIYWLVPKLGISAVVVLVLVGQLITSLVAGHFGWFGLPSARLDSTKLLGAAVLLAGALLVTYG